jgi:hypothetical protein
VTESEWLACGDPRRMLLFLSGKSNSRKMRLFAVACSRRVWHRLTDQRLQVVIETAEQFAEGISTPEQLATARDSIWQATKLWPTAWSSADDDAEKAAWFTSQGAARIAGGMQVAREPAAQSSLLRCIVGNPFRPVSLDPNWRTTTVLALAQGIYDERAFDRLPILADALQDAGCDNKEMLAHCRGEGPHARGCWVVDLVLGKQ